MRTRKRRVFAAASRALVLATLCACAPAGARGQKVIRFEESAYNIHKRYIRAVGLISEGSYNEAREILHLGS